MRRRKSPIDEETHLLRQIEIVQKRLQHLEIQKAKFGSLYVPPQTQLEIDEETATLAYLRRRLSITRQYKKKYYLLYRIADALTKSAETIRKIFKPSRRRKKKNSRIAFAAIGTVSGLAAFLFAWLLFYREISTPPTALVPAGSDNTSGVQIGSVIPNEVAQSSSEQSLEPGVQAFVTNTGGVGVRLRIEPRQDAVSFFNLTDRTVVTLIEVHTNEASRWWLVDIGNGQLGYINEEYLRAQ